MSDNNMKTINILFARHDEGSYDESVVIGVSHSWTPESVLAALRSIEEYNPVAKRFKELDVDSQKEVIDSLLSSGYYEFNYAFQLAIVAYPIF